MKRTLRLLTIVATALCRRVLHIAAPRLSGATTTRKLSCCLLTTLFVLLSINTRAADSPDATELTKLLNDFLAGASHDDAATHDRFWADDLIYTRSAGKRVNKSEIMANLKPQPGEPETI